MGQKTVYSFHTETREYVGLETADECQIEPGVWHIPANATEIEPPPHKEGFARVFGTTCWLQVPRNSVPGHS